MTSYREEQGRLSRMFAFWTLALLLLFGCTFLYGILIQYTSMQTVLGGIRLPVIGVDLNGAFLASAVVFAIGVFILTRWQQRPKVVDFLVDTEGELRKVTWPTLSEVINSSTVVVVCVVLVGAFLAGVDWLLARIMKYLILGQV